MLCDKGVRVTEKCECEWKAGKRNDSKIYLFAEQILAMGSMVAGQTQSSSTIMNRKKNKFTIMISPRCTLG